MKHILLSILAILTLAINCHADIADNGIYLRMVDDADNAIASGDYEKAEKLLLEAMNLQPDNPSNIMLLSNLGMVRYYAGKDSLALKTLDRAHEISPASVTVLLNRARVRTAANILDSAIVDYNRVCHLDSTVSSTYFYRGMIRMSQGRPDLAESDFEKLKAIEPDSKSTAIAWASLLIEYNRTKEAIPWFSKIIKIEQAPEYYSGRALCYLLNGDLGEASADIASGLELSPDDGLLYLYRALLNKLRYLPDESERDLRHALELGVDPIRAKALMNISSR